MRINELLIIEKLRKSPGKIVRIGKSRRTPCKGGCGRMVWGDYCRKCQRRQFRAHKRQRKQNKRRKNYVSA